MAQGIALGLSVVPAFGFTENYGESSILRYNQTRVYTRTIDISPSIAFQLTPQWSIGFGPDAHYFSAQSKAHVRTESTDPVIVPTAGDSFSRFSVNNWAYGGHVGVLFKYDDHTRVGVNYRSKLMMHLGGYSDFNLDQVSFFETNAFQLPIALPASTTFSVYHDMTPCWALMGTIAYDQWSSIQNYHARNYIEPSPTNPLESTLINVTVPQDMHNTVDLSVGTHYKINEKLMLRASFKYEPTPTSNSFRYVNFPDGVKYGVQVGSRYQATDKVALDFIYGHVFVKSGNIDDVNPATDATAVGRFHSHVDLLGGQLVWNLC